MEYHSIILMLSVH